MPLRYCEFNLIENGVCLNSRTQCGETLLHIATKRGHYKICELFIENGMNVNKINSCSGTPIQIAARQGYYDICKLLIENGAELDSNDVEVKTCK